LLVTTPPQHGAAPLSGAGGSAIGLSAAGAYVNVPLPAVKGECPMAKMVAVVQEERRVISMGYLRCLLNYLLCLIGPLSGHVGQPHELCAANGSQSVVRDWSRAD
jgi:hypothetical protein